MISAQEIVKNYLLKNDFSAVTCCDENENGVDIVAIKNNKYFLIEVKKVCVSEKSYNITPVGKSGLKCDYIAIVTPKNNIVFQLMAEHLKLCAKNGSRGVKKLIDIID